MSSWRRSQPRGKFTWENRMWMVFLWSLSRKSDREHSVRSPGRVGQSRAAENPHPDNLQEKRFCLAPHECRRLRARRVRADRPLLSILLRATSRDWLRCRVRPPGEQPRRPALSARPPSGRWTRWCSCGQNRKRQGSRCPESARARPFARRRCTFARHSGRRPR